MFLRHGAAVLAGSVAILVLAPATSFAQAATVQARAGHCQIRISATLSSPARLVVQRDGRILFSRDVRADELPRIVHVGSPMGTTTAVTVTLGDQSVPVKLAQADGTEEGCAPVEDDGEVFYASGYVGLSIDTFAAEDLKRYLNPNESGDARYHDTAGVNFEYRVFKKRSFSLWIVGETLHSVRSTDVNCEDTPELDQCKDLLGSFGTGTGQKFLAILRNADSVEANMALRLHLLEVNRNSLSPAALYVQAKLGYITVAGSDGDAAELRTFSVGFMAMGGRFEGSYLDVGFGRSDVYRTAKNRRFKVDGLLSIELAGMSTFRPYIQMVVDADRGSGPDSIQTFIGADVDLRSIFGR